jgi:hypothetical protein
LKHCLSFNGCNGLGIIILLFQRRYTNRPIVELENAAQEELKITELRLAKLFSSEPTVPSHTTESPTIQSDKAAGINSILSVYRFFTLHVCKFVVYILHLYSCSEVQTLHTVVSSMYLESSLFHSHHVLLSEQLNLALVPTHIVEHRPFCNLF